MSIICDELNINVWELIRLANHHPRVNILQPGAGVGGHCIAVDPWFIVSQTPQQARLIKTARQVNEAKPEWALDKIKLAVADCANQTDRKPSELAKSLEITTQLSNIPAIQLYQSLNAKITEMNYWFYHKISELSEHSC